MPTVMEGAIYQNVGKYARGAVMYAFEEIGGAAALATWAQNNPDNFYTKLFPKVITRETEVHHTKGVAELLDMIDADYEVVGDGSVPVHEEFPESSLCVDPEFDEFDIDDVAEFPDE